jgi:hypothetical protein
MAELPQNERSIGNLRPLPLEPTQSPGKKAGWEKGGQSRALVEGTSSMVCFSIQHSRHFFEPQRKKRETL